MHKFKNPLLRLALVLLALLNVLPQLSTTFAQGTAFTYDGLLQKGSFPQNGTFNFSFTLFNVATNGTAIAGPLYITGVTVKSGAFTAMPDFGGAVWNGQTVWLEIGVEGPGETTYTPLSPRQQIMPTPYAIYAESANNLSGTLSFSQLTGTINNSQLANNSITVTTGTGLSGGTTVPLDGGSLNLLNTGVTSLTGGDGVTVSAATGNLTLGLGSTLTLPNLPVAINSGSGSLLYADNNQNCFTGQGAGSPATAGFGNSAFGSGALGNNSGSGNTAEGLNALQFNQTGSANTANGVNALLNNNTGYGNIATGNSALSANNSGSYNVANGLSALSENNSGSSNTANGMNALELNENGSFNVGDGANALADNGGGNNNTAVGYSALNQLGANNPGQAGGTNNIALGFAAGSGLTGNESSNIDIGNLGVLGDNNITRIGTTGIQTAAYIAGVITGDGSGLVNLSASQITSGTIPNTELANSSITITPGSGLMGGGTVSLGSGTTLGIKPAGVDNTLLANPNITINTGAGLGGGNVTVPLGGLISLYNSGVTSLTGGGGVTVSATTGDVTLGSTATSSDTANAIVSRDGSGNFSAGSITLSTLLNFVNNIAIGNGVLDVNTTGSGNIGIGSQVLFNSKTGSGNIAIGNDTLLLTFGNKNDIAIGNQALQDGMEDNVIAIGDQSLESANFGVGDTAIGQQSLEFTPNGSYNTAVGYQVMQNLFNVSQDTAVGFQALQGGATESPEPNNSGNTAVGFQALQQTAYAVNNTGVGIDALLNNTNGNYSTAIGAGALAAATNGNYNIAVGYNAGSSLKTGDENIDIGNTGVTTETGIIRIGTPGNQTAAYLAGVCNATAGYGCQQGTSGGSFGHTFNFWWTGTQLQAWVDTTDVGVVSLTSDQRLKENIEPMTDDALTRVMALKPSTFNYKNIPGTIFQGDDQTQEGFIADELQRVIPSAVNGQKDGLTSKGNIQPQTVNLMPVVAVLTKAVQDQQKEMLDQPKEIDELKAMVKTLSAKK